MKTFTLLAGLVASAACGNESPGGGDPEREVSVGDAGPSGSGTDTENPSSGSDLSDRPTPGASDEDDPANPTDPASPESPSTDLGEESGPGALPADINLGGAEVSCDFSDPGISPLMKLSTVQYRNTVRDLLAASGLAGVFGSVGSALARIPDDSLGDSFRTLDPRLSLEHVQGYLDVGTALADAVVANPSVLEALVGDCVLDEVLSRACATDFLRRFLKLAYRRPVGDAELAEYLEIDDGNRSPAEVVHGMLVIALSSPRFVNHVEIDGTVLGTSPDVLQLTAYEIASRLSYTFWQSMPDAQLFAAADDGSLATEEGFEAQLTRIFEHSRTRETLWQFWNEWTKLEKFTGFERMRPAFRALANGTAIAEGHDTYADMVQEIRDLTELFTFARPSTLADLLTTDLSVTPSAELAELYGVQPHSGSGDYPRMPEGTRAGLLQRGALLVSNLEQTNPFHRGALLRRAVLCDPLPQPDPNSLPPGALDPPPLDEAQTTRQRFQAKVEGNGLCEGCHAAFSDIGYVLESYDALGRYRSTELVYDERSGEQLAELEIDTRAVARIDLADDREIANASELNQRIVDSGKVEACVAQNYFKYVARRELEARSADACVIRDLGASLQDSERGLSGAFRRIAQYDAFFQRKVGPR